MKYLDFDVLIEGSGDGYRTRVLNSPAGQAGGSFVSPFSELEVENFLLRVGHTRRGMRRLESPEMEAARQFGSRLFEAVFDDDVLGILRSSLNEAARQGAGLRLRLRLADAPELADLPWEYLYDSTLDRFLVLSAETPLVRYPDVPQLVRPLTIEPPLRVVVMISSPRDYPPLDTEREWAKLKEALGDLERQGLVALERLDKATLEALRQGLRRSKHHVFHFVGHGGFDEQAQDGVLVLEDEQGRGRQVSGRDLGTMLHDHRSLRLAVLNACEGARAARNDPFAGAAQSLVRQGIPAVIAMQFEISDEAAIALANGFYGALAEGDPVDAAVAAGRQAIFAQGNNVEWGTPVLYLRAPDGHIFDVARASFERPSAPAEAPEMDEVLEQQLERLYTDGLSAQWLEEWDRAYLSFRTIVEAVPDYRDVATRLKEIERQRELSTLYAQALAALGTEPREEAIRALQELVDQAPDYKDAMALLREAKRESQLVSLYTEARRLHEAQQWEAVLKVFDQIRSIDPDYADPTRLRSTAEQAAAARIRQTELDDLYNQAVQEIDAGNRQAARNLLEQVDEREPGYREVEQLLARIESADRNGQQQTKLDALYREAAALVQRGEHAPALDKMQELSRLEPTYPDPQQVVRRANEGLAKKQGAPGLSKRWAVIIGASLLLVLCAAGVVAGGYALFSGNSASLATETPTMVVLAPGGIASTPSQAPSATPTLPPPQATAVPATEAAIAPQGPLATVRAAPTSTSASPLPTLAPTRAYGAGDRWIRSADGMEVAYVPSDSFTMGSDQAAIASAYELCTEDYGACDRAQYESEGPLHEVALSSFWIDRTEVTSAQYAAFLNQQGNKTEGGVNWLDMGDGCPIEQIGGEYTPKAGFANHPVVCVSWYGAAAYAEWVGGRLPTEAEWEYAARGPSSSIYPWGSEIAVSFPQVNFCDKMCEYDWALERIDDGHNTTAPVDSYPDGASWIGALNMAGNVWEWTQSLFQHYETGEDLGDKDARAIRGGSFTNLRANVRGAYRGASVPTYRNDNLGFRVVIPGDRISNP